MKQINNQKKTMIGRKRKIEPEDIFHSRYKDIKECFNNTIKKQLISIKSDNKIIKKELSKINDKLDELKRTKEETDMKMNELKELQEQIRQWKKQNNK